MKFVPLAAVVLLLVVEPAWGGDDMSLARMATCGDSWFDWQTSDPARLKAFAGRFRAGFSRHDNDAYFVPKSSAQIAGLRVTQVFPDSVGMGVGFSAAVDVKFDETRRRLEKMLGKPFVRCETSDGMRSCELQIADKRTAMIMADDDPKSTSTLIGCYYFYEK
ncbi:MAG: hypothetical protein ABSA49_07185 [Rhizomicrobium sp.]|jgi:hypothetical protein